MARGRGAEGPWGGALARRVADEVKQGWSPGLTLLHGEDAFHLEAAQRVLVAALVPDASDPFAVEEIVDGRVESGEVVERARSVGMFARRRVVVVRDAAVIEGEPEPIARFAADPPEAGYLIVRARRLDRKRRLHQALASGRVLEFRPAETEAERRELIAEGADLAQALGLRLGARALAALVDAGQGDLNRLANELAKLRAWCGGDGAVTVTDEAIRDLATGSEAMTGWELGDLILARDRSRALAVARRYTAAGDEAIKIVGGLAWRGRTMLQAKALLAAGGRPDDAVAAARAWGYRSALLAGIERYTLAELLAFPARLLVADRDLKSRQIGPRAILESLVDDLTGGRSEGMEAR